MYSMHLKLEMVSRASVHDVIINYTINKKFIKIFILFNRLSEEIAISIPL